MTPLFQGKQCAKYIIIIVEILYHANMGEVSVFLLSHFSQPLIVALSAYPFSLILWGDSERISD